MSFGIERQEKNWLVKSSTRILGPYSVDEIAQLLLKKHISIIDEVRQPIGRWKYIREHRIFEEVVQSLRAEQENASEHTQTMTATATLTSTAHTTITRTDVTPNPVDEMTPTPLAKSDAAFPRPAPVKDIVAREVTVPSTLRSSGVAYGDDRKAQQQLKSASRGLRWGILGFAVVLAFVIWGLQARKNSRKEEGYNTLIEEALRYRSLQLYEKSLVAYRKASQIKTPDGETQLQMALPLIVLDRQNVQGRRLLEREAGNENNGRVRMIEALLGISMSYILEGSLKEAEDSLQKVLVLEPLNFHARLNLALISLRKGDWKEAETQLDDLQKRNTTPHALMLLARGVTSLDSGSARDVTKARTLTNEIRSMLYKSSLLKLPLLLVEASLRPVEDPAFNGVVTEFLSQVSRQSNQYVHDLRLDWRIADWEVLDKYCRDLAQRHGVRLKALRAICLAEAGRDSEAKKFLDEALAEAPKDPMVLFTQANLFYRNGLRNEAFAVLRLPELAAVPAKDVLQGLICLDQGDLGCAERSFRAVLASGSSNVVAMGGLADVLIRQDRRDEAQMLIRDGLDREPLYVPLIELRDSQRVGASL